MLLEFVLSKEVVGQVLVNFTRSFGVGLLLGLGIGYILYYLLIKNKFFPESTHNYLVVSFVFFDFWASEYLESESGLMSVMVIGIILSNIEYKVKEQLMEFLEKITRIIVSILFVLLSANFDLKKVSDMFWISIAIVVIIILARFPVIFLSTRNHGFNFREKIFLSWIGPRGIIALSVASIISIKLQAHGFEKSNVIEILVFILITTSIILQGLTAKYLAYKLNIIEKGDKNIIILGINEVTLFIAEELKSHSKILFVDSNKNNCMMASQFGFQYREGNAFDPSIYEGIDLENYSTVLASTDNNEINILFCRFLKNNFGFNNLFAVLKEKESSELAGIIQSENIKLAFSSSNSLNLLNKANISYFKRIREYLSTNKKIIYKVKINNSELVKNVPGKYPIPDEYLFLIIKRNQSEFYIYHNKFQLELKDEIYFISNEKDAATLDKLCIAKKAKF